MQQKLTQQIINFYGAQPQIELGILITPDMVVTPATESYSSVRILNKYRQKSQNDSLCLWREGDNTVRAALILRDLKDISESECKQLYHLVNTYPLMEGSYKEGWWETKHIYPSYSTSNKAESEGVPVVWAKLLEWGFDLFGLINDGIAFDENKM